MLNEIRLARGHLVRRGLAVAGFARRHIGAAFEDVRDEDVAAAKSHGLDDLCEKLAGFSDERLAYHVFIRAGSLAYEHDFRIRIADSEHDLRARFDEVRAFHAGQNRAANRFEPCVF